MDAEELFYKVRAFVDGELIDDEGLSDDGAEALAEACRVITGEEPWMRLPKKRQLLPGDQPERDVPPAPTELLPQDHLVKALYTVAAALSADTIASATRRKAKELME